MASHNSQSFDITDLVEQYRGKKLEEIYQENYQIRANSMGKFMELIWKEDDFPCTLKLHQTRKKLLYNLKTVHYIGEFIENRLKGRGIRTLKDLRFLNDKNKLIDVYGKRVETVDEKGRILIRHNIDYKKTNKEKGEVFIY